LAWPGAGITEIRNGSASQTLRVAATRRETGSRHRRVVTLSGILRNRSSEGAGGHFELCARFASAFEQAIATDSFLATWSESGFSGVRVAAEGASVFEKNSECERVGSSRVQGAKLAHPKHFSRPQCRTQRKKEKERNLTAANPATQVWGF